MRLSYLFLAPVAFVGFTFTAVAAPITGQISFSGFAEAVGSAGFGSATGIDFANGAGTTVTGSSGLLDSYGAGTGTFVALGGCNSSSGSCGTIDDIASFATESATSNFLILTTGGPTVSFDLSSISSVSHSSDASGGSLNFIALGTINFSGFNATPGELSLTADGTNITAYSGRLIVTQSAAPTPEPGSVVLLGTGLLTAAGAMRRRLVA